MIAGIEKKIGLIRHYLAIDQPAKARREIDRLGPNLPSEWHAAVELLSARVCAALGEYIEAEQIARRYLAVEPDDVTGVDVLIHAMANLPGKERETIRLAQEQIKAYPEQGWYYYIIASSMCDLDQPVPDVEEVIHQGLKIDPHYLQLHQLRFDLWLYERDVDKQLESLQVLSEFDPDSNATVSRMAQHALAKKDFEAALQLAQDSVRKDPANQEGVSAVKTARQRMSKEFLDKILNLMDDIADPAIFYLKKIPVLGRPLALFFLAIVAVMIVAFFVLYFAWAIVVVLLSLVVMIVCDIPRLIVNDKKELWAISLLEKALGMSLEDDDEDA